MPIDKKRQLEGSIKASILNFLIEKGKLTSESVIINEFTLDNFTRRIDLALVTQDSLIGFEVKSEADSLYRLDGQIEKYLEFFDKVVVVAASKYLPEIVGNTPSQVAIWEVSGDKIKSIRRGRTIKLKNKSKLINLMKANELKKAANKLHLKYENNDRKSLEDILNKAKVKDLRTVMLGYLRERFSNTSSHFLAKTKNRKIIDLDVSLLSPYKYKRILDEKREFKKEISFDKHDEDPFLIELSDSNGLFGDIPKSIKRLLDN